MAYVPLAELCALAWTCICMEERDHFHYYKGILHSRAVHPRNRMHSKQHLLLLCTESCGLIIGTNVLDPRMKIVDTHMH